MSQRLAETTAVTYQVTPSSRLPTQKESKPLSHYNTPFSRTSWEGWGCGGPLVSPGVSSDGVSSDGVVSGHAGMASGGGSRQEGSGSGPCRDG